MPRLDLREADISQIQRQAQAVASGKGDWSLTRADADKLLRLTGEVLELRNREAQVRQIHEIEGEY